MTSTTRRYRVIIKILILLAILAVFLSHSIVVNAARGRISSPDAPFDPQADGAYVGLVLGTSRYSRSGRPNAFFEARMDAAADLYRSGRVTALILSGDNAHRSYNEPAAMTQALVERGVPNAALFQDYAGFRTLDSVVRARDIFGQNQFIVISQRFHVERAIFLASAHGIGAWGYAARDVGGLAHVNVMTREYAARVRAVLDAYVLGTRPRFGGDPIAIEPRGPSTIESGE